MTSQTDAGRPTRILPRTDELTPEALRQQIVRNNAEVAEQGGAGPAGNARLTGMTGSLLVVLLALEGLTLIALRPLLSMHVFLGMLLIPPVLLKLASTGYRFLRYYSASPEYRRAGPPALIMRMLGPFVIAATVTLFGSGVAMLALGPSRSWLVTIHKASFIVWVAVTAVHVLGHVLRLPGLASADFLGPRTRRNGSFLRQSALAGALVAGLVLAVATVQYAAPWHHLVG
jgi:hypothetical protein